MLFRSLDLCRGRLENLGLKLKYLSPAGQIREKRTYALKLEERIEKAMADVLTAKRHLLEVYIERLKGLSPLDKLKQGFSYVSDEEGRTVASIRTAEIGKNLRVHVRDGIITAKTLCKESMEWEQKERN